MSVQLPPSELMFLRSLRRTAIVLLVIFRLDPQPVGRDDVAGLLDIDTKTSAKYLEDLSRQGLITRMGYRDGYILTAGGRQMVLGMEPKALPQALPESGKFPPSENPALTESGNSPLSELPAQVESGKNPLSNVDSGSKVEIFPFESGKIPLSETLEVKEVKSSKSLEESSREPESGKNPLSLAQVLEAAPALFDGQVIAVRGLEDADPRDALLWIAYAFRNRDKLDRPCGLIYSRLQKHVAPPDSADVSRLPRAFLKKLGLLEVPDETEDEPETIETVETLPPCPALDQALQSGAGISPREAWRTALKELQPEMARASFETWVRDTIPVGWGLDQASREAVLQVAVRNAYGREWLETRFTDLVTPLLCSLLGLTVSVRFIVASVSTETEE